MLREAYRNIRSDIRLFLSQWKPLPEQNPVLVYSMHKVGSTTITSTLRAEGFSVYKHHCLNPDLNAEFRHALSHTGYSAQYWLTDGVRFYKRLKLWRIRRENESHNGRLKIFTFVKDPLAVALSNYFMQLFEFMPKEVKSKSLESVEKLSSYFIEVLQASLGETAVDPVTHYLGKLCAFPSIWFEQELKAVTGVDVLDSPFSIETGYGIYHGYDSDIILVRTDMLSKIGLKVISELTGSNPPALKEQNIRNNTPQGQLYRAFVDSIRLPLPLVLKFYRTFWLEHFYSQSEIDDFVDRWTRGVR